MFLFLFFFFKSWPHPSALEQDITCLLQVEEEAEVPGGADDWRETSLGAQHDTRYEDIHGGAAGRGHAGEPGSMNDDSKWFGYRTQGPGHLCALPLL
jgi:hypothetical protein